MASGQSFDAGRYRKLPNIRDEERRNSKKTCLLMKIGVIDCRRSFTWRVRWGLRRPFQLAGTDESMTAQGGLALFGDEYLHGLGCK